MRIKDSSVDAVKAAIDMVELVSAYTPLRRVGSRYTARCPFHEERTPSFSVNAVDKLYYCYGCGAGGDAITFVREKEGLDFADAIEWLADRFHVTLEREEVSPEQEAATAEARSPAGPARAGRVVLRALSLGVGGGRACPRLPCGSRSRRGGLAPLPAGPLPVGRPEAASRRRVRRASRTRSFERSASSTGVGTTPSRGG